MAANEERGGRSDKATGGSPGQRSGRARHRRWLAVWEDRLLRGPGRVLDHPAVLRVFVVVGVLAATALSFNLVETAPSSGLLGGSPVGDLSAVSSSQFSTSQSAEDPCTPQGSVVGQGNDASSTCPSTTTTTPVLPSDPARQIGDSWSDSATVSGSAGAPTGTVTFYVCSPTQLKGATSCTSAIGTQIASGGGITNPVRLTAQNATSSTATSPPVTPNQAGTWCFAGYYTPGTEVDAAEGGQGGDPSGYSASADTSSDECFTVNPDTPGLLTAINPPGDTTVGNSWSDTATVSGNQLAGIPLGSVTFTLCQETAPGIPCAGGFPVGTGPVIPNGVQPSWPSKPVTPTSPGTYCFNAAFGASPSSNYTSVPHQGDPECFTVGPVPTQTTTQQSVTQGSVTIGAVGSVTDTATVRGDPFHGAPRGRVTFWLCWFPAGGDQHCPTTQGLQLGYVDLQRTSFDTAQATTVPYSSLNAVGTYCYSAAYIPAPGSPYAPSTDNIWGPVDDNECFTVNPADPGFSTQQSGSTSGTGLISVGQPITDTATVTGNPAGGTPRGAVAFWVCGPGPGTRTCAHGFPVGRPAFLKWSGADTSAATSATFFPKVTGTYCFGAFYLPVPGGNYNSAADNVRGDVDANECFVVGTPSFRVLKSDQPGDGNPVVPGSIVPYTLEIQNVGDGPGSAVVDDPLPPNLTMQGTPSCAVAPPDTCTVANTGSTWKFTVSLAPGDQATVTFGAQVPPSDTADVVNTATIVEGPCDNGTAPADDPTPDTATVDNCTSTVTNTVPDFTVTKTAVTSEPGGGSPVSVGDTITYTIVTTNVGDGAGSDTATDPVPPGLSVSGSPTCTTTSSADTCIVRSPLLGTTFTFAVTLAPGDSATATIVTTVQPSAAGSTLTNTATILPPCNTASGCSSSVSDPVNPVATSAVTSGGTTPTTTTGPTTSPVTSASSLAFTGAYLGRVALLALILLATGGCLVVLGRRHRIIPKHAARR